jgi:hypothetical protein
VAGLMGTEPSLQRCWQRLNVRAEQCRNVQTTLQRLERVVAVDKARFCGGSHSTDVT